MWLTGLEHIRIHPLRAAKACRGQAGREMFSYYIQAGSVVMVLGRWRAADSRLVGLGRAARAVAPPLGFAGQPSVRLLVLLPYMLHKATAALERGATELRRGGCSRVRHQGAGPAQTRAVGSRTQSQRCVRQRRQPPAHTAGVRRGRQVSKRVVQCRPPKTWAGSADACVCVCVARVCVSARGSC